jgi:hypothetical protein
MIELAPSILSADLACRGAQALAAWRAEEPFFMWTSWMATSCPTSQSGLRSLLLFARSRESDLIRKTRTSRFSTRGDFRIRPQYCQEQRYADSDGRFRKPIKGNPPGRTRPRH